MGLKAGITSFFTFCLFTATVPALAQRTNITDSTVTATPAPAVIVQSDNSGLKKDAKDEGLSDPGRAAIYSAILPGAGQFYNKQYWKIPIVYATLGAIGYFVVSNHNQYIKYKEAFIYRNDDDPTTIDDLQAEFPGTAGSNAIALNRDFYHTNRDFSIILFVAAYGLNIVEATVAAHLKGFDISDDLSLQVKPQLKTVAFGASPVPVLSLNLRLKK